MKDTPAARRKQTGDGAKTPPGVEWSGSEGDRNRFSLGPTPFPRRTARYVLNPDGSPITETTDDLLRAILEELREIRKAGA